AALMVIGCICALFPIAVRAASIPVPTTDHGVNADSNCSLVEAILAANTNMAANGCPAGDDSPGDTIILSANTIYTLTSYYDHYSEDYTGLPTITSTIAISGNNAVIAGDLTVGRKFRLLHISAPGDLTLESITLRNGYANFI